MLLFFLLCISTADKELPERPAIDYQKVADATEWTWKEDEATAHFSCLLHGIRRGLNREAKQGGYDLAVNNETWDSDIDIDILKDGRTAYTLRGHKYRVFSIVDDTLYFASFLASANGANIVAVDLLTGKTLWTTSLKGIGSVSHFRYRNRLNIRADRDAVTVFGNESFGQYVEVLDTKTGKTIGHKQFPKANK